MQVGAAVATPFLSQLLLGVPLPVDVAPLLTTSLQARVQPAACNISHWSARHVVHRASQAAAAHSKLQTTHTAVPSSLQVVLLPVLVGAAINTALPRQVAALAPLASLAATASLALVAGSVVAQNATAVAAAAPQLLGAVFAVHAGAGAGLGWCVRKKVALVHRRGALAAPSISTRLPLTATLLSHALASSLPAGGFLLAYSLSRALGLSEQAARTASLQVRAFVECPSAEAGAALRRRVCGPPGLSAALLALPAAVQRRPPLSHIPRVACSRACGTAPWLLCWLACISRHTRWQL